MPIRRHRQRHHSQKQRFVQNYYSRQQVSVHANEIKSRKKKQQTLGHHISGTCSSLR